jgi:nitrite reductase/ring-hydroxylating ferredoxin subunit
MTEAIQPASTTDRAKRFVVAKASEIPAGECLIVNVLGRSIGVMNVDGSFYAMLNRCPHRGAALCRGEIVSQLESTQPGEFVLSHDRKYLQCPWHGWEFDLVTGESWCDPLTLKARLFGVALEHGDELAEELSEGTATIPEDAGPQFVDPVTHRVKGPYRASVIPVSIEDDYIVITMRPARPRVGQAIEESHEARST